MNQATLERAQGQPDGDSPAPGGQVSLRLFVAGNTPNSMQANSNVNAFCRKHFPGCHRLEIVDVFRHPAQALAEHVFMTPTLVRLSPAPTVRIVGTLSHEGALMDALGLDAQPR